MFAHLIAGIVEMESFLKRHKLETLMPFTHAKKIAYLRTKLFNTRNMCRMQMRAFMKKVTSLML